MGGGPPSIGGRSHRLASLSAAIRPLKTCTRSSNGIQCGAERRTFAMPVAVLAVMLGPSSTLPDSSIIQIQNDLTHIQIGDGSTVPCHCCNITIHSYSAVDFHKHKHKARACSASLVLTMLLSPHQKSCSTRLEQQLPLRSFYHPPRLCSLSRGQATMLTGKRLF